MKDIICYNVKKERVKLVDEIEKVKIVKSIFEIDDKINNYERNSAIELIKKVRKDHKGKEQVAYVLNNVPLELGTDEMIINTLKSEKVRLELKLSKNN